MCTHVSLTRQRESDQNHLGFVSEHPSHPGNLRVVGQGGSHPRWEGGCLQNQRTAQGSKVVHTQSQLGHNSESKMTLYELVFNGPVKPAVHNTMCTTCGRTEPKSTPKYTDRFNPKHSVIL